MTSVYSLEDCIEYINNKATNIDNCEDEGILTAIFCYLVKYGQLTGIVNSDVDDLVDKINHAIDLLKE